MGRALLFVSVVLFGVAFFAYALPAAGRVRNLRLGLYALGLILLTVAIVVRFVETGILPFASTRWAWGWRRADTKRRAP